MKNTSAFLTRTIQCFTGLAIACLFTLTVVLVSHGAENWKDSFEDICSKVDVSSTLSIKELEALIDRSDKLSPEILKSDDPGKKVYLRRLKNCRSMFEFAIESKKNTEK